MVLTNFECWAHGETNELTINTTNNRFNQTTVPSHGNGYYGFVACNAESSRCDESITALGVISDDVNNHQRAAITAATTPNGMDVELHGGLEERSAAFHHEPAGTGSVFHHCFDRRKRYCADEIKLTSPKRFRSDSDRGFLSNNDSCVTSYVPNPTTMDHEDTPIAAHNHPVSNFSNHHSSAQSQSSNNIIDPINTFKSISDNTFTLMNNSSKDISIDQTELEISKLSSKENKAALVCCVNGISNHDSSDHQSSDESNNIKTNTKQNYYTNMNFIQVKETKHHARLLDQYDDQLENLFLSLHGGSNAWRHLSNFINDEIELYEL